MTSWQEFPLRPQGQPWPGLNTRGGALDNGSGQLEDGSFGMVINEADILEKRKGMVRGLDEQFTGVVCGLFRYTDECGREWLLVADQDGIAIRQPFAIPVFENSDAYPFDSFQTDPSTNVGEVSTANWRNTSRYTLRDDKLVEVAGAAAMSETVLARSEFLRWFKEATNQSYQVRIEYEFEDSDSEQHQAVVIKGNGDLLTGAYIQGELVFSSTGTYQATLYLRDSSGNLNELVTTGLAGFTTPATGFFTVKYQRDVTALAEQQFLASMEITPQGGSPVTVSGSLNAIQDADLGQVSATGVGHRLGVETPSNGVKVIDGGPL